MLGDILKQKMHLLKTASIKKNDSNSLWVIIRDIAVDEIFSYGKKVDSDQLIPLYYEILSKNTANIPQYYQKILKSNKQERFRVVIRNVISTNAFHPNGLANQSKIKAYKEVNENKKGYRVVYQKR